MKMCSTNPTHIRGIITVLWHKLLIKKAFDLTQKEWQQVSALRKTYGLQLQGGCEDLSLRDMQDFRHRSAPCSLLAHSVRLTGQPFTHLDTVLGKGTPALCRKVSLAQPCRAHMTNIVLQLLTQSEISILIVRGLCRDVVSWPVSLILPDCIHSCLPWMCEVKSVCYLKIVSAIIVSLL